LPGGYPFFAVKEINMKTGWKTTEFWMAVFVKTANVVAGLTGIIPPTWAAVLFTASSVGYGITRGMAKIKTASGESKPEK
jgi:hypothetical protein